MELVIHREDYALTKIHADTVVENTHGGRFFMTSRLGREITVACERQFAPAGQVQAGFRLIEILGEFALDSVGIVAAVTAPLAAEGISLFAFSVWSADVLLVQDADIERAARALTAAGHTVARA